jgi:hypothetical protein
LSPRGERSCGPLEAESDEGDPRDRVWRFRAALVLASALGVPFYAARRMVGHVAKAAARREPEAEAPPLPIRFPPLERLLREGR